MRIADEEVLNLFRTPGPCELCGRWCQRRQPHHTFQCCGIGGASRLDIAINLAALGGILDCDCHGSVQGIKKHNDRVKELIADREKRTVESIQEEIWEILRAAK